MEALDTLALQLEYIPRLCALVYMVTDLSVKGRNHNVRAQGCLGEGYGHLTPNVVAAALKYGVGPYGYENVQVAAGAAVCACVSFAAYIQYLIVVDTRGNRNFNGFLPADLSLAIACMAGLFDYFACSVAFITGLGRLHHAEGCALAYPHLARAAAGGAGFGLGALFRAGAAALGTIFDLCVCDFLFAALCGLFKRDSH